MRVVLFCLALALAGCAKGNAGADVPAERADPPVAVTQVEATMGDVADPGGAEVVRTCKVDADCAVKNVGNCCGYFPACVNKDSPTFPERVKAACASSDTMSICGFQEPAGCACVEGRCASTGAGPAGGSSIE